MDCLSLENGLRIRWCGGAQFSRNNAPSSKYFAGKRSGGTKTPWKMVWFLYCPQYLQMYCIFYLNSNYQLYTNKSTPFQHKLELLLWNTSIKYNLCENGVDLLVHI